MYGHAIDFVALAARIDTPRRLSVTTPLLGAGVLLIGERGIQATWDDVTLEAVRRRGLTVLMDVRLDGEGNWTAGEACVKYGDGRPLERLLVDSAKEAMEVMAPSETLAAISEGLLVYPNAILHALREGDPNLEDGAVSIGVERVLERLDATPRMREIVEAVDARRKPGDAPIRDRLEDIALTMRNDLAPSF